MSKNIDQRFRLIYRTKDRACCCCPAGACIDYVCMPSQPLLQTAGRGTHSPCVCTMRTSCCFLDNVILTHYSHKERENRDRDTEKNASGPQEPIAPPPPPFVSDSVVAVVVLKHPLSPSTPYFVQQ